MATTVALAAIASACSPTDQERPVVAIAASPAKIPVPDEWRRPCATAPKPEVDPATGKAPEDKVFDMSSADRFEIRSCDRRRAAAVAAIDAHNGVVP